MCISIIQRNIQKQRHFRKIGIRSNSSVDSILKDRNILRDTLDESDVDEGNNNITNPRKLDPKQLKEIKKKERKFEIQNNNNDIDDKLLMSLSEFNGLFKEFLSDLKKRK